MATQPVFSERYYTVYAHTNADYILRTGTIRRWMHAGLLVEAEKLTGTAALQGGIRTILAVLTGLLAGQAFPPTPARQAKLARWVADLRDLLAFFEAGYAAPRTAPKGDPQLVWVTRKWTEQFERLHAGKDNADACRKYVLDLVAATRRAVYHYTLEPNVQLSLAGLTAAANTATIGYDDYEGWLVHRIAVPKGMDAKALGLTDPPWREVPLHTFSVDRVATWQTLNGPLPRKPSSTTTLGHTKVRKQKEDATQHLPSPPDRSGYVLGRKRAGGSIIPVVPCKTVTRASG